MDIVYRIFGTTRTRKGCMEKKFGKNSVAHFLLCRSVAPSSLCKLTDDLGCGIQAGGFGDQVLMDGTAFLSLFLSNKRPHPALLTPNTPRQISNFGKLRPRYTRFISNFVLAFVRFVLRSPSCPVGNGRARVDLRKPRRCCKIDGHRRKTST